MTTTFADLEDMPNDVTFGRVIGNISQFVADVPFDADTLPDRLALLAKITFAPNVAYVVHEPTGDIIFQTTIVANVKRDGSFVIDLVATDNASLNPQGWAYDVTISPPGATPLRTQISVPGGSTQTLGKLIGAAQPGVAIAKVTGPPPEVTWDGTRMVIDGKVGPDLASAVTLEAQSLADQAAKAAADAEALAQQATQTASDAQAAAQAASTAAQANDMGVAQLVQTGQQTTAALTAAYAGRTPAASRTIFVAPYGDDSNAGLDRDKPKATIAGALSALGSAGGLISPTPGTYVETQPWGTIPATTVIRPQGGTKQTVIRKAFSGDLATLSASTELHSLYIDAQGASYTGTVFTMQGTDGSQALSNVTVVNADGPCLSKGMSAGSNAYLVNCTMSRVNAGTGTGRYAIVIESNGLLNSAVPLHLIKFSSAGTCAIDLGSCNNVQMMQGVYGDINWTDNSRGVQLLGARWLNQMACTLYGHNNVIIGDTNPQLTIGANADAFTIGGSMNRLPVIDASGNGRNNVLHAAASYTPVLYAGSTVIDPASAGVTITGSVCRQGSEVRFAASLVVGSSPSLPTSGELRIGLAYSRGSGGVTIPGRAYFPGTTGVSGSATSGDVMITGAYNWVRILVPNTATYLQWSNLQASSTVYVSGSYMQ